MWKRTMGAVLALGTLAWASPAAAGGYDTPMLYSARHMGMGGTAIGYVSDPSALFHNPAGLARIDGRVSLMGDFSLLVGDIQGSPAEPDQNVTSNTTVAPFFLVGGAFRITDWLVAGVAVYPVASAGATYEYEREVGGMTRQFEDATTLLFIEASHGVAVEVPDTGITLGAGYRITYVSLDRTTDRDGEPILGLDMKGTNFLGFRAGAQWEAIEDQLSLGVSYRHKTVTEVTQDEAVTQLGMAENGRTEFTLPSRLGFGVRGDYDDFGVAIDLEYGFNSQNEQSVLAGEIGGSEVELANVFAWEDAVTLRVGAEYRIEVAEGRTLSPRLGYVFDDKTANEHYPTAFGTPPAHTQVVTAGAGYEAGDYEVGLAYAYRWGSAEVTEADVDSAPESCAFCGQAGEYALGLHGIYLDFSYDFQ